MRFANPLASILRMLLGAPIWIGLVALVALPSPWSQGAEGSKRKVVFIAGGPSHDYGSHEHYAGCKLLADAVHRTNPNVQCEIVRNGWPADDKLLDDADSIVIYSDGGGGHPSLAHLDRLNKQMERGAGLVCIHYAVEVPKEKGGPEFLRWLGGYFETHWSVNPHWVAKFDPLPMHPITRGVRPFATNDEWYYHMRFPDGMKGVTPILSAVPPASTMDRPDGPHSGNPDVRREVARGTAQHVAWATERDNGGRSFGYTGGHFHWNWGKPDPTRLVSNAILWSAKVEVPETGAVVEPQTAEQLQADQDEAVPANFNLDQIAKSFDLTAANKTNATSKLLFSSQTINKNTSRNQIDVGVDIRGVKKLYLIVTPGRDGFSCDWADWVEPRLINGAGEKSLLDLNWFRATSDWGSVHKNANANGQPLLVRGASVRGIGTHAYSVIGYDLPSGFERLEVTCAMDDGGIGQNDGTSTSVRFHIAAEGIPDGLNDWGAGTVAGGERNAENAVAGLVVADGLAGTLAASEPVLKSLTNIDIDHRGRVWACEVVNYRRHKDDRPEGDRILILEDTNQDGVMDSSKVFYQGRDIDSAIGLCVLGNRVLVSAAPYVWEFIDTNGDDIPDSKRAILTKTGDPQHDHSVHSFLFGPDGKLYFNYGNTGHRLCDTNGNPIKDRWGREINDSGNPYRQGMAFRCNEDLSDMEVVGHNFRNNYELAVDSFGTIWQSDNDDDGNRATRINYVMEFGNFGYTDEVTGAGWQVERTNWEPEIPRRHWHLNDPGVVPNMLITGAGSPTGITVNEGSLLPARFQNQVIHCDAGPNVVRAYIAKPEGAGYAADIENIAVGEYDKWFRPADACMAPDGSLYVSDWYDPGVGGHNMEDMERGRLFRFAPPGSKYIVPKYDFKTVAGSIEALQSSNSDARYLAFQALVKAADAANPSLKELAKHANPRFRARALWVLAKTSSAKSAIGLAAADKDADVRATGVRIARQSRLATRDYVPNLLGDSSPVVLRELAIALREDKSSDMPKYWAALASKYDGRDRWYLEALGIAAMDRWQECLEAWTKSTNQDSTPYQQIVWRARGPMAAKLQASVLRSPKLGDGQILAMFRGLEFQPADARQEALRSVLEVPNDRVVVEALMRIDGVDLRSNEKWTKAVSRYLASIENDPSQLNIIRKLKVPHLRDHLVERASAWGASTSAVQALDLALEQGAESSIKQMLTQPTPTEPAVAISKVLALSNRKEAFEIQRELLENQQIAKSVRVDAAVGLSRNKGMHAKLIELAKADKLPVDAKSIIGATLRSSEDANVRQAATELFPSLKTSQNPLPPIEALVKRAGNPANGKLLYTGVATCSQCHIVGTDGKNVGPNLTEIGSKLGKDAMYLAILAPSAGISHSFESYSVRTKDGDVFTGLLVSDTAQGITVRDAKGIERSVPREDVDDFKKQEKSLMPENLQETMNEQGLIDLVEYLTTLKK